MTERERLDSAYFVRVASPDIPCGAMMGSDRRINPPLPAHPAAILASRAPSRQHVARRSEPGHPINPRPETAPPFDYGACCRRRDGAAHSQKCR